MSTHTTHPVLVPAANHPNVHFFFNYFKKKMTSHTRAKNKKNESKRIGRRTKRRKEEEEEERKSTTTTMMIKILLQFANFKLEACCRFFENVSDGLLSEAFRLKSVVWTLNPGVGSS